MAYEKLSVDSAQNICMQSKVLCLNEKKIKLFLKNFVDEFYKQASQSKAWHMFTGPKILNLITDLSLHNFSHITLNLIRTMQSL